VGVEAAQVCLAELHENFLCGQPVAGVLEIGGFGNGARERIIGVGSGQHLLHLELGARPPGEEWLGPFLNQLTLLAPVVLLRVPDSPLFKPQRHEAKRARFEPGGFNLSGEVRVTRVAPLFSGFVVEGRVEGCSGKFTLSVLAISEVFLKKILFGSDL